MNCNSSIHGMLGGGGGGFKKGILSSVSILSLNFFNAYQPNTKSLQKLLTIGMSELTDIWFSRTCNHKDSNGFCNAYGFQ